VAEEGQPAQVSPALQLDAEVVGAAGRSCGQGLQMPIDQLLQPLARDRLTEAKGVLGVDVERQGNVALRSQFAHQICESPVIGLFHRRVARPDIQAPLFHKGTAVVAAVEDDDHRMRPASLRRSDDAVQAHRHVAEAALLGEALLDDRRVAQVVLDGWGQVAGGRGFQRLGGWCSRLSGWRRHAGSQENEGDCDRDEDPVSKLFHKILALQSS
jgi:hypothetical protein